MTPNRSVFWAEVWREIIEIARARGLHFLAGLALGIAAGCIVVPL